MKKVVEYLKKRIVAINENNGSMTTFNPNDCCVISGNEAQKIIDFYESTVKESGLSEDEFENGGYSDAEINCKSGCMGPCGQCKEDTLPEVPDITPKWENISGEFIWCSIDSDGDEFISRTKPICYEGFGLWHSHGNIPTGRRFDMDSIDWTKTLSERPK